MSFKKTITVSGGGFYNIINKYQIGIRTNFGKFNGYLQSPGIKLNIPFYHKMYIVDMREQIQSLNKQSLISKDNVTFFVDGMVQWKIIDPIKATFNVI